MIEFKLTRVLKAPRAVVWDCFTNGHHLQHWMGPKGTEGIVADMDLRTGGNYHYALKTADGSVMWGLWRFRKVEPMSRIELLQSFSDENRGITRHPMAPTWPFQTFATYMFEDVADGTRFTLTWAPYEATETEIETFKVGMESMNQGWGGTMERLDAYLTSGAIK